jgi:hypothetical protein
LIAVPIIRSMSGPVAFDLRQDGIAQGQHQQGEGEIGQGRDPEQHAQQAAPWRGWQAQAGT